MGDRPNLEYRVFLFAKLQDSQVAGADLNHRRTDCRPFLGLIINHEHTACVRCLRLNREQAVDLGAALCLGDEVHSPVSLEYQGPIRIVCAQGCAYLEPEWQLGARSDALLHFAAAIANGSRPTDRDRHSPRAAPLIRRYPRSKLSGQKKGSWRLCSVGVILSMDISALPWGLPDHLVVWAEQSEG